MTESTVRKVVLPANIIHGLLSGDAMANQGAVNDMAAYDFLRRSAETEQPYTRIFVLEGEEKVLRHIADYLDGLCEYLSPCKERFGFTKADAREAYELMVFQLDK